MKKPLFAVAAVLVGLLAGLSLFEVGLRVAGVDPVGKFLEGRGLVLRPSEDPILRYELVPGSQGYAFGTDIRVNSAGFRDREYERDKPAGTRRLLVIGDSITFGNGLRPEERFTDRLEARYRAEGKAVQVLNLGVTGYDPLQELELLEKVGLAFHPDVVLQAWCINDAGIHTASVRALEVMDDYGWLIRKSRLLQVLFVRIDAEELNREMPQVNFDPEFRKTYRDFIVPVAGDTSLVRRMRDLRSYLDQHEIKPPVRFLAWYTSRAKVGRMRWAMERLARLARDGGFRAAVLIVPYLDEHGEPEAFRQVYDIVAYEAQRAGLDVIRARDELAAFGFERAQGDSPIPLHPGAEGHEVLAEVLHEKLRL